MKLALILLACCVGISYQQGYGWIPLYRYSPRFLYPELNELDYNIQENNVFAEPNVFGDGVIDSSLPDTQARAPFNFRGSKPERKFFVPSLLPNSFFPFNFRTLPITTVTTTVLSTVSSTALVATMQVCIPSNLFVTQAGLITLTTQCRRKRDTVDFESQIEAQEQDSISPSAVLPLTITDLVPKLDEVHQPDISSSRYDVMLDQNDKFYPSTDRRQNRGLSFVLTTTSVITTYSFSTTTIKKTVSLSSPNALSCLPVGYAIC